MPHDAVDRFRRALTGEAVLPVAEGLTFVAPSLLPGPGGSARAPQLALARACADLRLDFAFVPSWEPWALAAVAELHAVGVAAAWAVPGVLTPTLDLLGAAAGLRMIAADPARVTAELDAAEARAASALAVGIAAGADAIVVADDLAGGAGPIAAPAYLESDVFPRLARLAQPAGAAGLPALLHCDGAVDVLYAFARSAGFVAVHGDCGGPMCTAAALAAARRAGVALIGGLAASQLTDAARGAAAGASAAALATGGGLLLADDGGVAGVAECAALFAAFGAARR
jgi:hypothetical protein